VVSLDGFKNIGLLDDFLFFDGVVALPLLSYFVEGPAVEGFVADALVALRLFIIVIFRVGVIHIFVFAKGEETNIVNSNFEAFIVNHCPSPKRVAFLCNIWQN